MASPKVIMGAKQPGAEVSCDSLSDGDCPSTARTSRTRRSTWASVASVSSRLRLSFEVIGSRLSAVRGSMVSGVSSNSKGSQRASALSIQTTDLDSCALSSTAFSEEIRRCSVSSHTVLKRGGSVLSNQNDQSKHDLFASVNEHTTYDYFISHNWSVARWKKFLSLCMIWSGKRVLICCCLVQLLCFCLVALKVLPLTNNLEGEEVSIWCTSMSFLTFFLVFIFSSDVLAILGVPGYRTFLDKVCVDQSDEDRKREGIGAITAFLYHSDAMVVLYSEMYLTRIWTVYELTTFLALRPDAKLLVQPVILGPVVVYFAIIQMLRIPELLLLPSTWDQLASADSVSLVLAVVLMTLDALGVFIGAIFLRIWGATRANMEKQINKFAFESAACHDENDRVQILSAIKKIARQSGLVTATAPTKECIKSYEAIVRSILPRRMKSAFQLTGIPGQVAFLMALTSLGSVLDVSATRLAQHNGDRGGDAGLEVLAEVLQECNLAVLMPAFIGLVGMISGVARGSICFEVFCTLLCFVLLVLGLWFPGSPLLPEMSLLIPGTELRCAVLAAILVVQLGINWILYGCS